MNLFNAGKPLILISLVFLFFNKAGFAQIKAHYIPFAAGWSKVILQDRLMSVPVYRGNIFYAATGYQYRKTKVLHVVDINLATGSAKQRVETNKLAYRNLNIGYSFLKRVVSNNDGPLAIFAGASLYNRGYLRNHRQLETYGEIISSLNFRSVVTYDFTLARWSEKVSFGFYIPFWSYILRPGYAYSPPEAVQMQNPGVAEAVKAFQGASVNRYFRWNNSITYEHQLLNGNLIAMTYLFDYYRISFPEKLQSASHTFHVSLFYSL